jgi:hypothetical protein
VTDFFADINGHQVVEVSRVGRSSAIPVCLLCGAHFLDRFEIENTTCPAAGPAHGHDLINDPGDGLLYCTRCPFVAYDLNDVATDPICPMPLHPWGAAARPEGP